MSARHIFAFLCISGHRRKDEQMTVKLSLLENLTVIHLPSVVPVDVHAKSCI